MALNWNGDEFSKKLERATGKVQVKDLFPATFMSQHTKFVSMDEMAAASGLFPENYSADEAGKIMEGSEWNKFVPANSSFPSWKAMMAEAVRVRLAKAVNG